MCCGYRYVVGDVKLVLVLIVIEIGIAVRMLGLGYMN